MTKFSTYRFGFTSRPKSVMKAAMIMGALLAILLAFNQPGWAQTDNRAQILEQQIEKLRVQIRSFDKWHLDDPEMMIVWVPGGLDTVTRQEFLQYQTEQILLTPDLGVDFSSALRKLTEFSNEFKSAMRHQVSELTIQRDQLVFDLQSLPPVDGPQDQDGLLWDGDWRVTSTHLRNSSVPAGTHATWTLSVDVFGDGTCVINDDVSENRNRRCRVNGNRLDYQMRHNNMGWLDMSFTRSGDNVTGEFKGTGVGSRNPDWNNVYGTYEGHRL